jgi:hypothetical protein
MGTIMETMAGPTEAQQHETARAVCVEALDPVIRKLQRQGMRPDAIIGAMTVLSVSIMPRGRNTLH